MTLRFVDSFDHYATADFLLKWDSINNATQLSINSAAGRRSTNGLRITAAQLRYLVKNLTAAQTWIVGFALNITLPVSTTTGILSFLESGTTHVDIRVLSDGSLRATRNGTTLGTSAAGIIASGSFNYIEVKCTIDNSAGAVTIRVNGAAVLTLTSQDTQNGGTAVANQIRLGDPINDTGAARDYDDLYICDTAGSVNNDFLGDVRVDAYLPSGNGNSSQLVGSDSNSTDNYLLVDETAPDSDTTYVQSSTATNKDTYVFPNMSHTPSAIHGVQINAIAKKDDAGTRSLATVVRSNGSDTDGTSQALSTSYLNYRQIHETDPDTAAAWIKAGFDAAEFGVKVAA